MIWSCYIQVNRPRKFVSGNSYFYTETCYSSKRSISSRSGVDDLENKVRKSSYGLWCHKTELANLWLLQRGGGLFFPKSYTVIKSF